MPRGQGLSFAEIVSTVPAEDMRGQEADVPESKLTAAK